MISSQKLNDVAIIGAGIAGCAMAHKLSLMQKKVIVFDMLGIAGGGSGAAGAFLSPLPGKKNPYNALINTTLEFSLDFYQKLFPTLLDRCGILRVPSRNFDQQKLKCNAIDYAYYNQEKIASLSPSLKISEGYYYQNAAVVSAKEICHKLLSGIDFVQQKVQKIEKMDGYFSLQGIKAKKIVLAQGVYPSLRPHPYFDITPIFGVRIDVKSQTNIPCNLHKNISISRSKEGTIAIGATQQKHDGAILCESSCEACPHLSLNDSIDVKYLLEEASKMVDLQEVQVAKTYMGARATNKGYFPIVGKIVDFERSIAKYPSICKGTKIPPQLLSYADDIYLINALGSRGFVQAPYLANLLSNYMYDESIFISKDIMIEKHFYKFARRL